MKNYRKQLAAKILLLITLGVFHNVPEAYALPSQGTLINANAADIAVVDKQMNITGKGLNNIINWASFNIAKGETVKFNDKNNYLNLVHGVDMSRIYGTISGGNMVYLVNPNGILFAEGTRLDNVGSFLASTRNISSINKEAFLNDPANANAVLGADNKIMDNKDYYPEDSSYVPKISVADIQLTNVPESATKIILDGPGGVILKNTEILDKTAQILTRKGDGEIGIGSDTGEVVLTDTQKQKISLIDGASIFKYDDSSNVIQGYQAIKNMEEFRHQETHKNYLLNNTIDAKEIDDYTPIYGVCTFDGLGYEIQNLKIKNKYLNDGYMGLWGSFYGELRNLGVTNIDYATDTNKVFGEGAYVGGIIGRLHIDGIINNVYATGNIETKCVGGGLIGNIAYDVNRGRFEIRNSYNETNIIGRNDRESYVHSGFWLGGIVGDQVANNIYMYNIYNFGDITAIQNVKNTPYASTNIYIGGISSSNVNVLGAYNGGNIKAIITDTDLAVNNNCSVNIGGILGVSGDINNKIGSTYNCGNLESNAADITNIGGIFGKGINDSEYEYVATINDKQLHSYYNKTSTRINGIVVNGNNFGIVVDDVNDIYNGDMLGIYDVDSIGEGMSNTPKPIIPDPTPKPDPIPNPDPIPQPDPDPVKPVVPSVFDPNNKEYDGIISTVTQDYIDSLVDKNVEKIKNNSINDTPVKKVKVYEEVTPPKDYEITRKRIMDSLAEKLIEAKKAMDNEEVAAKQNAYEKLKSYITLSPSVNLDEKVYEAFLKPISEKIKASKINEYDSNISFNFVKEIGGALFNGLKKIPDQTVKVGNKVYSIHYDMDYTYQGLTSVIATVTWKEGKTTKSTRMVLTNVNKKDGAKALAEYSYGLAKLNKDVWVNAATELVSVGLKDIKGNSKALVATKKIEAFSEKLLNALSDDALAEAFAVDIGGATKDVVVNEGKNVLWNTASKRFEKLIEKQIPGGSDIIELAHGLQKLEKEFDTYNNSISTYQNDPNQVNKINAAYWGVSQMVNNMISGL